MSLLTFFPGPTKVPAHMAGLYARAFEEGVVSISHRSTRFSEMYANTVAQIKEKLAVPAGYEILFASSATECWEIVAQSLVAGPALHLYSGSFGGKWFEYARRIRTDTEGIAFDLNADPLSLLAHLKSEHELLALTHNETSNATMLPDSMLAQARAQLGDRLLAVDATSSLAGVVLPWALADVWFASCQKCFGMPAGLAVLVVGPRALARTAALGDDGHYNSLTSMLEFGAKNQTTHTPNMLSIVVLGWHLELMPPIEETDEAVRARAARYYAYFEAHPEKTLLVTRPENRSPTVVAVGVSADKLAATKAAVQAEGMLLGNGYGKWKESTYRIANFPAYTKEDQERLLGAIDKG